MIERLRVRIPAESARDFSSPELTLCADLFGARSSPVLPQWHVKYPGHSAQSAHKHTRTLSSFKTAFGEAVVTDVCTFCLTQVVDWGKSHHWFMSVQN